MNVFDKDLGLYQGRIATSSAPSGAFVYELGHALLSEAAVNVGDYSEVAQTFAKTAAAKYLTASIIVTVPPVLPVGRMWEVSAWLNSTKMVSRLLRPSKRPIKLEDWRVSLYFALEAPDTNVLAFRLELV